MHPINSFLSEPEKQHINDDELHSLQEINHTVSIIENLLGINGVAESKVISKLLRAIHTHQTMKYNLSIDERTRYANVLMNLYNTGKISVPIKLRLLKSLQALCRKADAKMTNFSFSWKPIWNEILLIVSRDDRHETTSCEQLVLSLITTLVEFLHSARHYIAYDKNTSEFGDIFDSAMKALSDTRYPICVEGVLLLVNCLPTDFAHYDAAIPLWIEKWSAINHNATWDCCWLTLLTRARKYTTTFDWTAISPFLLAKSKELMQLPTLESGGTAHNLGEFPHTFPAYYSKLLTIATDARKVAVNKIAKLVYFLTLHDPAFAAAEIITVTPPIDTTADNTSGNRVVVLPGFNSVPSAPVNKSAVDVVLFLQSIRTYLYPSNAGAYTPQLAYFLATFVFQLCRHVAKGVAVKLFGSEVVSDGSLSVWTLHHKPLHLGTVRYLVGSVLSLLMEGLYSKNQVMTQFCSSCLKNIASIDASIGDIFVPFLLTALDPAAVNQSHQAPVAMSTISLCFKSLLFPSPVILKYLPDILRLSLPGIDASDANKTSITLAMYSNVLAWLPITSAPRSGASTSQASYLSLVNTAEGVAHVDTSRISSEEYDAQWATLSAYMTTEWAPALLERLFTLLDAQELKVKGTRESPVVAAIGQVTGYLFQSVSVVHDPALRKTLEDKVMEYFVRTTPANASKGCAKVMESVISTNPAILSAVLKQILTADIVSGEVSSDKLAYRIYLAAGACRAAHGVNVLAAMSILEPVLTSAKLVHHLEKPVRKATGKLVRDVLKGTAGFYPVNIAPMFANNQVIGAPNQPEGQVEWHVPSPQVLVGVTHVLQITLTKCMKDVSDSLTEASSSTTAAASLKKVEESIANNLHVIERAIRGAAEVLGDEGLNTKHAPTSDDEVEAHVLSTGRHTVLHDLQAVSPESALYLRTIRHQVLTWLSNVNAALLAIPADSAFSGLKNNTSITPQWTKVYTLVVTRRMTALKDVDNIKKWLKYTKRTCRSSISKIVYKTLKSFEVNGKAVSLSTGGGAEEAWLNTLRSKDFWQYHDLNTNTIMCGAWLQHGVRCLELSFAAVKATVPAKNNETNPYIVVLKQLVALSAHEYDAIRNTAARAFEKVSGRFGFRITDIIKGLITTLSRSDSTYLQVAGALALLKQPRVSKRIMTEWEFTEQFLGGVSSCQGVISAVEEVDKRERLMHALTEVFVKYLAGWSHVHLDADQSTAGIIRAALSNVGHQVEPSPAVTSALAAMEVASDEGASDVNVTTATVAAGLRFETFAAYILLHFIGHRNVDITSSIWKWAIESLSLAHGQPAQSIALAGLARLAQIANVHQEFKTSSDGVAVRALLNVSGEAQWKAILHGVAQCHPKHSDDGSSAQWSQGIDHILRGAEFLKIVLNRNITCILSDKNLYSHHFRREDAGLFYSLALSGLLDSSSTESVFSEKNLAALFAASKVLPSSSEAEVRSNNATRSELFSGLLRAYHVQSASSQTPLNEAVQKVFLSYLLESIEKLSVDFMRDWAEALYFAFNCRVSAVNEAIPAYILDAFKQLLRSQTASTVTETAPSASSEEGFAEQGKVLLLTKALLQADLGAATVSTPSQAAYSVYAAINEPGSNLVSPYRTSRIEIASILSILVELSPSGGPDLSAVRVRLAAACASLKYSGVSSTPASSEGSSPVPPSSEMDVEGSGEDSSTPSKAVSSAIKNASETACIWLQFLVQRVPLRKSQSEVVDLLSIAVLSTSSGELELVKLAHDTAVFVAKAIVSTGGEADGLIQRIVTSFESHAQHASWRVRETVMKCLSVVMANNWPSLTADQRKACKDIYQRGISDVKPEVVQLAKGGMVAYLAYKTGGELNAIAAAYVKNSDALAVREKKKRKLNKDSNSSSAASNNEKPDAVYSTTVNMMSCLLLCTPYDLPQYTPALVTSLVRHVTTNALKDSIAKSVQIFKMSHQDRWEEFKLKFTREQLEDLQGAGAASYFS